MSNYLHSLPSSEEKMHGRLQFYTEQKSLFLPRHSFHISKQKRPIENSNNKPFFPDERLKEITTLSHYNPQDPT